MTLEQRMRAALDLGGVLVRRILVTGSRTWDDELWIRTALKQYLPPDDQWFVPTVMHGNAPGADRIAKRQALDLGFVVEDYPADWRNGKRAGPERNRVMLDKAPDVVIAFRKGGKRSKGTTDCIEEARRRRIPVVIHDA